MLSGRWGRQLPPMPNGPMIKRFLLAVACLVFTLFLSATPSRAQGRAQGILPLGSVEHVSNAHACGSGGWDTHMTCFDAVLAGCNGAEDESFTYGYERNPRSTYLGTIVMFSGWGGTSPISDGADLQFAEDYYNDGFEVVMLAWNWDWELTYNPLGENKASIQAAACRPATFLKYVYTNPLLYTPGPTDGMCAQGYSAGSSAIAYALAWYGADSYLDNAELLSGPVFSRIDEGCEVPAAPNVAVCPAGQQGCVGWPSRTLALTPEYINGYSSGPQLWTGIQACVGSAPTYQYDQTWNDMSIVSSSAQSSQFSYPGTSMAGYLCASTQRHVLMNDSASQGELFYEQINGVKQNYSVNAIYSCPSPEGVADSGAQTSTGQSGFTAIAADTFANCKRKAH